MKEGNIIPTEHFNNLKPDRKNTIIRAATREFATKNYADVSVRDIADRADISRGSFYLYFKDKEDAYYAVVLAYKERLQQDLINIYKNTHNVRELVLQVFDYFTHLSSFEHGLFEKIAANMTGEMQQNLIVSFEYFGENIHKNLVADLEKKGIEINQTVQEQVALLREIMFSLLLSALIECGLGKVDSEIAREKLGKKVDIIMQNNTDIL